MCAIRNTFKAYERLKRETHIETLFRKGKAFSISPLRIIYIEVPRQEGEISPVRIGFSISKKKMKRAVQRNRVKRLLREAWRVQKQQLYDVIPADAQLHLFIVFTSKELPDLALAQQTVGQSIDRLAKRYKTDE